jgi:hypothetical protein
MEVQVQQRTRSITEDFLEINFVEANPCNLEDSWKSKYGSWIVASIFLVCVLPNELQPTLGGGKWSVEARGHVQYYGGRQLQ